MHDPESCLRNECSLVSCLFDSSGSLGSGSELESSTLDRTNNRRQPSSDRPRSKVCDEECCWRFWALPCPWRHWQVPIDFSTNTFASGTITPNLENPFSVSVVGTNGAAISLSNVTLVPDCSHGNVSTCTFSSGTLAVSQAALWYLRAA